MLPAPEALVEAQRLLDDGRPFHAHEVLEAVWKASPADERDLWQGLAQVAVGLTHLARGNRRGAAALLLRGRDRIAGYRAVPPHGIDPHGIDIAALTDWATTTAEQVLAAPTGVPGLSRVPRVPLRRIRPPGT